MKKLSIFILTLLVFTLNSNAQRKLQQLDEEEAKKQEQLKAYEGTKKGFDPSKLTYGGNVGGGFSGNYGYFLAQPMVGYMVKPKTMLGTGFTYIYESQKFNNKTFTSTAYGPLLFARQGLFGNIFAHVEYAPMNYQVYKTPTISERQWFNQLYVGGGMGGRGAQIYLLYNVLHDQNPYANSPWYFRIGFMF
ncbi:MAG: hypothetical protein SGJ00_09210 [bacterium]|nr:hypothetical protein [bacterium]